MCAGNLIPSFILTFSGKQQEVSQLNIWHSDQFNSCFYVSMQVRNPKYILPVSSLLLLGASC